MRHVLVAEDDEGSRVLLEKNLEKHGFLVTAVADGEAALAALSGQTVFDAVILDVMMPKRSGLEVLEAARAAGHTLPIIMATAAASPEDIVAALGAGADDYVTKPYSFPVLLARLQARLRIAPPRPVPKPAPQPPASGDGMLGRLKAMAARLKKSPPPVLELKPGARLGDRYVVEGRLGAGAFGTVYRARHVDLAQDVAVKVLTRQGEYGSIEALRKEAQSACQLRHPNVVRVYDFGLLPPRSAFLVMELLEGPTLDVALARTGTLTPQKALPVVRAVLGALAAMNREGLVHRDVKPANVLLHHEAGREVPKLLDFGTARSLDEPDEADALLGSLAYISPERFRGDDYDGRADVYSCGVLLYKVLTGRLPIDDTKDVESIARWHLEEAPAPPSTLRPELPAAVDALVLKLLSKTPASRPVAYDAERLISAMLG